MLLSAAPDPDFAWRLIVTVPCAIVPCDEVACLA
jgi:hypothetical protein